tara:strand:+ start:535 stop:954 length:420 start_codon:yes stop_codon:yes gene_type:complete
MNFKNSDGTFDRQKWLDFMNNAIQNIDERLPTKNLKDSLLWKNNAAYRVSTFDNGWQLNHSLYDLEFLNQDKVLVKCEPNKYLEWIDKAPRKKGSYFNQGYLLLKKLTKFAIYYRETNQIREIDMSEYIDLGLKKYIIK